LTTSRRERTSRLSRSARTCPSGGLPVRAGGSMSSPRARATAAADVPGGRRELHTFRGNLKSTRHGWLRLTPAYSVRLVDGLLEDGCAGPVLDPFCGTGTTLLSCSEHGIDGDSVDINPFLVWLARSKVARYSTAHVEEARRGLGRMRRA